MKNSICRKLSGRATLVACVVGAWAPGSAHAEASAGQKAAAESLFDDGVKALRSAQYAEACSKFEESERIDPGIGTLLYLGECYERIGRTASAWATFREAASTAQAQGESERAHIATGRADRLQPGLSKLTLRAAPSVAQLPGLRVSRDNVTVAGSLLGVGIPVDPGKYHIAASADGYETYEGDIEIKGNGDAKVFDIPTLKAAPSPPAPLAIQQSQPPDMTVAPTVPAINSTPQPTSATAKPNNQRTAAYVVGAVGIVGLGLGSYFGLHAISKNNDAKGFCPTNTTCSDPGPSLTDDAKHSAVASNIAITAGAALVAAGVVLYLTSAPKKESARLELHPVVSGDLAGIGFAGVFR